MLGVSTLDCRELFIPEASVVCLVRDRWDWETTSTTAEATDELSENQTESKVRSTRQITHEKCKMFHLPAFPFSWKATCFSPFDSVPCSKQSVLLIFPGIKPGHPHTGRVCQSLKGTRS